MELIDVLLIFLYLVLYISIIGTILAYYKKSSKENKKIKITLALLYGCLAGIIYSYSLLFFTTFVLEPLKMCTYGCGFGIMVSIAYVVYILVISSLVLALVYKILSMFSVNSKIPFHILMIVALIIGIAPKLYQGGLSDVFLVFALVITGFLIILEKPSIYYILGSLLSYSKDFVLFFSNLAYYLNDGIFLSLHYAGLIAFYVLFFLSYYKLVTANA